MARLLAILVVALCVLPTAALGQGDAQHGLAVEVRGSPIRSDGSGPPARIRVHVAEPVHLRVRVADFDGRTVRQLVDRERRAGVLRLTWRGQDAAGDMLPPGPYRIIATAAPIGEPPGGESELAGAWLTIAARPVYPVAPSAITIVVDPGHGGSADGAVAPDGTREADLDLDIGLRLARMLEGAGVNVVLTRSTDSEVNTPPLDRTSDGIIDETDELAARPDIANAARADVFVAVHNNIAVNTSVGGPSTYYVDERTFGHRSRRLARLIQARMMAALASVASGSWRPYDHGALVYPYYVLRDYDPPRLLRPTRMPGVLSEGLFLSNPRELRLLKQRRVRGAMANAYYEAIAAYLAGRPSQVGYGLVSARPGEGAAGAELDLRVEVRNQGSERMRGWLLVVGALPAGSTALGRGRTGPSVGERPIPPLAPGTARNLRLRVSAPAEAGEWVLVVDAADRRGRRASRSGSPVLEVPLTVVAPSSSPSLPSLPPPSPSAAP